MYQTSVSHLFNGINHILEEQISLGKEKDSNTSTLTLDSSEEMKSIDVDVIVASEDAMSSITDPDESVGIGDDVVREKKKDKEMPKFGR